MTVIACFKDFGGFLGAPNLQKCSKQMCVWLNFISGWSMNNVAGVQCVSAGLWEWWWWRSQGGKIVSNNRLCTGWQRETPGNVCSPHHTSTQQRQADVVGSQPQNLLQSTESSPGVNTADSEAPSIYPSPMNVTKSTVQQCRWKVSSVCSYNSNLTWWLLLYI